MFVDAIMHSLFSFLLPFAEESKPSYARLVDLARTMPDSGWFGRMVRHRPRLAG